MKTFINVILFLFTALCARSQYPTSPGRTRFIEDSLRAAYLADSVSAAETGRVKTEEKERNDRETFWVQVGVLSGAAIFCIWAALYKKRYREQFTINGRYIGIGSKYYHDHHETDHYDPDHRYGARDYSVRPQDDPWCFQEHLNREARLRELRRRADEARKGGGASASW